MKAPANDACHCASLSDLAAVPMGGDGLDDRVFRTIEVVQHHGGDPWWLFLARCRACHQNWMVAQDERMTDTYFLRRLAPATAARITDEGSWPEEFLTYERVLETGRRFAVHWTFMDDLSPALVATVEDLRAERPEITVREIAELLNIHPPQVERLLRT